MLRRFLAGLKKVLKESKGFSLVEVTAVVAVTGVLSAVVVPVAVDKILEGKKSAAMMQCKAIGTAITGFVKDTGIYPTRDTLGTNRQVAILASGAVAAHNVSSLPTASLLSATWADLSLADTNERLYLHLTVPDIATRYGTGAVSGKVDWKGPYLDEIGTDPWGNPYLVLSSGFYSNNIDKASEFYGWILSMGPNSRIDTNGKGSTLNDSDAAADGIANDGADDIGYVLYRYQPAQSGMTTP